MGEEQAKDIRALALGEITLEDFRQRGEEWQ
jgi:hypothetical protein